MFIPVMHSTFDLTGLYTFNERCTQYYMYSVTCTFHIHSDTDIIIT